MSDPAASPAAAAFLALATTLGLQVAPRPAGRRQPYRAAGRVDGIEVILGDLRPSSVEIPVRIESAQPRDLRVEVFSRRPRHVYQQHDASHRDGLWRRGPGAHDRVDALLAGEVGARLRELADLEAALDDRSVTGFVRVVDELHTHIEQVRALIALSLAVDLAAVAVPIAPELGWAGQLLASAAATLHLTFTSCPLGLRGELGGCRITSHTQWGPSSRSLWLSIGYQRPFSDTWALRAHDRTWWQRLHGAVHAFGERSPHSGRFAFDRRFYLGGGDRGDAIRAVTSHLDALIEFADQYSTSLHGDRLVVGVRLHPRAMPDVVELMRRAVAIAQQLGAAPGFSSGPFR